LYLHPRSSMVRNATITRFNVESRFAEIGMKGALAALQFERLDCNQDQKLEIEDLVGTYGRIKGVSFIQAYSIAHLVISAAKEETAEMKKSRAILATRAVTPETLETPNVAIADLEESEMAGSSDGEVIDFGKFLLAREGGAMIPWSKFLIDAEKEAESLIEKSEKAFPQKRKACERIYEAAASARQEQERQALVRIASSRSSMGPTESKASKKEGASSAGQQGGAATFDNLMPQLT